MALKAPSRTYVRLVRLSGALQTEKIFNVNLLSNVDTGDVRGSQRHTEAVTDVKVAGGARIDKSTALK